MIYAFVAYTIIWLGVTLYVFSIAEQQRKLSRQIEALEAAVAAEGSAKGAGAGSRSGARRA